MENQVAKELPKLLRITKATVTSAVNKHLLNPWRIGEIVRVCPIEEQKSVTKTNVETFRKNYVVVMRKVGDEWKKWTWVRSGFELIK